MNHLSLPGMASPLRRFFLFSVFFVLAAVCASGAHAQRVWGVNGHPDDSDYAVWNNPEEIRKQLDYLKELGSPYYRISFSASKNDPRILKWLVDEIHARQDKVKLVPVVFADVVPSAGYQSNYDAGYAQGKRWAEFALSLPGSQNIITHWELGNETSLARFNGKPMFGLVTDGQGKVVGNPLRTDGWEDKIPGSTEAMAGMLRGLYWGIKNAYKAPATTQILFGDLWIHFGYVQKLKEVRGAQFLPADILSWHWYAPRFGSFTAPLVAGDRTTSPAAYASRFGKKIWVTEIGREDKAIQDGKEFPIGGSATNLYNTNQNWAYQADALMGELNDLVGEPAVTGIFVYQLYDETLKLQKAPLLEKVSQEYHGLVSGEILSTPVPAGQLPKVARYRKNAFYTYRDYIRSHPW